MFKMVCMSEKFRLKNDKEQYDKWKSDFTSCLKALDLKLVEHSYMCGEKLTVADIIIFNELSMFAALNGINFDSPDNTAEYPNLVKWFRDKMLTNQTIKLVDDEMKRDLANVKKTMPS